MRNRRSALTKAGVVRYSTPPLGGNGAHIVQLYTKSLKKKNWNQEKNRREFLLQRVLLLHQSVSAKFCSRCLLVQVHHSVHAVRDDADGDQRHGGALGEGQQVEEGGGVCGRLEGVEQMQQHQGGDDTRRLGRPAAALFGLGVEGRVQAQPQPEQGAHVAQETGERRGV